MQVDFNSADAESEHNLHLSPHPHYNHQGNNGSPAFTPFRHPAVPAIDPGLDQTTTNGRNSHSHLSVHGSASPHLHSENASLNSQHMSQSFYGDMSRSSITPSTPSNSASPRYSTVSPSQSKQLTPGYVPNDRAPPSRDVSDETIDDAYAAFILYCNPSFPTSTDTLELTKAFRVPPKSDGKSFSTWFLFELIRKFDLKEIKTWTQLALELGVEPPDMDKGQSTQKVQQYSVRLKRWMRAMHIDAFFEYLLGKQHAYYMQIPPPHSPFPENGRDGVSLEEDLAIRALDPKFRPKRGRRKTEDPDDELEPSEHNTPPRKRPQLDTSIPFGNLISQPQSAYPNSAHPDDMDRFLSAQDPWATASAITPASAMTTVSAPSNFGHHKGLTPYSATPLSAAGQQLRWRLNTQDNPSTPHSMSAVTPQSARPPDFPFDEPQSAVTPSTSKSRSRRRHGPAVSSAWPSNNSSSSGKLRGRPPSNRSVRDGPFVTFPANPKTKEGPTIEMNRSTPGLTPIMERAHSDPPMSEQHFRFPPSTPASAVSTMSLQEHSHSTQQGRPSKLQLQVPQHVGGPVRLVTPTLLVNGEQDLNPSSNLAPLAQGLASRRRSSTFFSEDNDDEHGHEGRSMFPPTSTQKPQSNRPRQDSHQQQPGSRPQSQSQSETSSPVLELSHETLNRALAAELLRAEIRGRRKRLRGSEAKNLAAAILQNLRGSQLSSASSGKSMADSSFRLAIASCLGLCGQVGMGSGGPTGSAKKVVVQRFRIGGDGYDSPVDEDEDEMPDGGERIRESFDVVWNVTFGGLTGEWTIRGVSLDNGENKGGSPEGAGDEAGIVGSGSGQSVQDLQTTVVCWKTKFLEAQRRLCETQEEIRGLKDKVLEAVL